MKFLSILVCAVVFSISAHAQNTNTTTANTSVTAEVTNTAAAPRRRGPVFRATKDQVTKAQTMLKTSGMYAGEATGKLDAETRAALKKYQEAEGLRATGTLNRVTLEKMGIELTERQRAMR